MPAAQRCFLSRTCFTSICLCLLLSGCSGLFQGKSEYEQLKDKEGEFAKLISAAGGSASKEGRALYGLTGYGWFIDLTGAKISNELIEAIVEVAQKDPVFQLKLGRSTITNDQLVKFDEGKVLQKTVILDLSNTTITDAGLDRLANHYIISELSLKGSPATAAAAKRLGDRQIANPQTPPPFRKQPKLDI